MAVNKPTGDNARKGAVRKCSQLKGQLMGKTAWTKRDKRDGEVWRWQSCRTSLLLRCDGGGEAVF
jgi:hypothetical protein